MGIASLKPGWRPPPSLSALPTCQGLRETGESPQNCSPAWGSTLASGNLGPSPGEQAYDYLRSLFTRASGPHLTAWERPSFLSLFIWSRLSAVAEGQGEGWEIPLGSAFLSQESVLLAWAGGSSPRLLGQHMVPWLAGLEPSQAISSGALNGRIAKFDLRREVSTQQALSAHRVWVA